MRFSPPSASLLSLPLVFFFMCVCVFVCACVCMCVFLHVCVFYGDQRVTLSIIPQVPSTLFLEIESLAGLRLVPLYVLGL